MAVTEMRLVALVRAVVLVAPIALAVVPAAPVHAQNDAGKALYEKNCAQCHGEKGDGNGVAAPHLMPRPRDFTSGKFKIRTTPSGKLPTDADLHHIIKVGMRNDEAAQPELNTTKTCRCLTGKIDSATAMPPMTTITRYVSRRSSCSVACGLMNR